MASSRKKLEEIIDRKRNKKVWDIKKEKSALLAIDLQNDFVKKGAPLEVPGIREKIPKIKKILELSRKENISIIYTKMVHKSPELAPRLYELFPFIENEALVPESNGTNIYPEIAPSKEDFVVEKIGYNAFFETELETVLRNGGNGKEVDTLLMLGVVTNVCVESTARGAYERSYKVALLGDLCSAFDEELHEATLRNISYGFGRVLTSDEVFKNEHQSR